MLLKAAITQYCLLMSLTSKSSSCYCWFKVILYFAGTGSSKEKQRRHWKCSRNLLFQLIFRYRLSLSICKVSHFFSSHYTRSTYFVYVHHNFREGPIAFELPSANELLGTFYYNLMNYFAVQVRPRAYYAWCIWNCRVMDDHKEPEPKEIDPCNDALLKWTSC